MLCTDPRFRTLVQSPLLNDILQPVPPEELVVLGAVGGGSMAANVVYGLAFSLVQMTGGVCSFKPCMVRAFVSD